MDPELLRLIRDYQARVAWAVDQIEQAFGVVRPTSAVEWVAYEIPHGLAADGNRYYKHGFGIAVDYEDGAIDFDFGEHGEIDGFSSSRLFNFAENADERYAFASEADVAAAMARAEARGELRFSGYMLHYVAHGDSSPA